MMPQTDISSLDSAAALIGEALRTGFADDLEYLESVALSLVRLSIDHERQHSVMVDAVRFFYITGRAQTGVRVAVAAQRLATETAPVARRISSCILLGVCAADSGDLPRAMEVYAEGLTLAQQVGDAGNEAKLWLNTGSALIYGGMYREALACFQKVLALGPLDPVALSLASMAHLNTALCSLNLDEYERGLNAMKLANDLLPPPSDAFTTQNRVLAENYFTRLLIEVGDYDGALTHAKLAREYASKSKSPRADIQASVAEGLAETFSGNLDVGISRLKATNERTKSLSLASREVLVALVKALEFAGRHDEALKCLQEMLSLQRKTAEANALHHVQQHLVTLHGGDSNSPIEDIKAVMRRMETHVEVVEGRMAKAELIKQRQELFKARVEAMERLAVAAELRDDATGAHSYRVGRLASILAKEAGCDLETVFMIDIAGRLHDIGKSGIPDGVLLKPSSFNTSERLIMETHSEIGASILAQSEIPNIKMAEEIARHHHERWDGRGYPAKIGGEEIPLPARITALADVFDALTHKRPYKPAWSFEAAMAEIMAASGKHFDPDLTNLFLTVMTRLRREHPKLDDFLGEAALASPFIQARGKIWETLQHTPGAYRAQ